MKNLFVEFLNTNNRERQKEYDDTLSINNQLNYFDNIYIIKDKNVVLPFQSDKFKIILQQNDRTTYQFVFDLPEAQNDNDINILANSDIYFDNSINLINDKITEEIAIGLSRWYLPNDTAYLAAGHHMHGRAAPESNDVWIWKGKNKVQNGNFPIGYYSCDCRIMQCFVEAEYRVYNPAISIKTWHNHITRPTSIPPNVEGPYWKGPENHHTIGDVK